MFWPFLGLVFEINHSFSNSIIFTIRKNTICDDCQHKKSLFTKKNANFLISALKSSEKGGRGNISII